MKTFRILSLVAVLGLIVLGCGLLDWGDADPAAVGMQLSQAGERAAQWVTESAPLRATSARLVGTVITGGKTEMPPVMTQVARALTLVELKASDTETLLFIPPHAGYTVAENCAFAAEGCETQGAHSGVDSMATDSGDLPVDVVAVGPGRVARLLFLRVGCSALGGDCGLGNTVILEHTLADGSLLYSLYAHLDSIDYNLVVGQCIAQGTPLGKLGASGDGQREYWPSPRLHFEFKSAPVLGDPRSALSGPETSPEGIFFGAIAAPTDPDPAHWGYYDPAAVIGEVLARACP